MVSSSCGRSGTVAGRKSCSTSNASLLPTYPTDTRASAFVLIKSTRPITRRVQSIAPPPWTSPEPVAPGASASPLLPVSVSPPATRMPTRVGSKYSGAYRRFQCRGPRRHATRWRRKFPLPLLASKQEKHKLEVLGTRESGQFLRCLRWSSSRHRIWGHRGDLMTHDPRHDGSLTRPGRDFPPDLGRHRTTVWLMAGGSQGVVPDHSRERRQLHPPAAGVLLVPPFP